jgi:hypothetical protein
MINLIAMVPVSRTTIWFVRRLKDALTTALIAMVRVP